MAILMDMMDNFMILGIFYLYNSLYVLACNWILL